jgi:hypothetical protein
LAHRTHLFLASFPHSRGEITLALRVADQLNQQGDRVVFLACRSDQQVFSGRPFDVILIDQFLNNIDPHLQQAVQSYNADSLILVDVLTNSVTLGHLNTGKWLFTQNTVPVLALDVYHLVGNRQSGDLFVDREIDFRYLNSVPKGRILPVPFIPPDCSPDVYNSLPAGAKSNTESKRQLRDELGISENHKLILMVGAAWQSPSFWHGRDNDGRRIASLVPRLLTNHISRVHPDVHVIHVGPEPYRISTNLKGRYTWVPQLDHKMFQALLCSADLFITPNLVGTTLSTVIATGLPMLVVRNSVRADTLDEAMAGIPGGLSPDVIDWLTLALPIYRFLAWPIGYFRLVSELLENNPFVNTFRFAELLDESEVVEQCRILLFDENARIRLLQAQSDFDQLVRKLPKGSDIVNRHLEQI